MIKEIIQNIFSTNSKKRGVKNIYKLNKRDIYLRDVEESYIMLKDYIEIINILRKENQKNLSRYYLEIMDYGTIECSDLINKKVISQSRTSKVLKDNSFISYIFPFYLTDEYYNIKLHAMPSPYSEYIEIGCELYLQENNKLLFSISTDLKLKYCDDNIHNILENVYYDMIDTYYKKYKDCDISFKLLKNLLDCSICDYIQYDFIKEEYPA